MPPRPASIKVRALQWLAQREHSPAELRGKLLRLTQAGPVDPDEIHQQVDTLLDWLTTQGYLSAQRFVDSRVHVRQPRYGNLRIQQELRHHGLALDADARQALKDSEQQRAAAVLGKKYAAPANDATERVRQMRFLSGRGFSPDVIRRVVRAGGARADGLAAQGAHTGAQAGAQADAQADAQALDELP